jgi:hypothetical protein
LKRGEFDGRLISEFKAGVRHHDIRRRLEGYVLGKAGDGAKDCRRAEIIVAVLEADNQIAAGYHISPGQPVDAAAEIDSGRMAVTCSVVVLSKLWAAKPNDPEA